jgi:hypothetical protein
MIPSIEDIYSYYHRETMFAMKGFYPRKIVNFEKCLTELNIEYLKKFQKFIERNENIINWKLYIIAISKYYKRRFDLRILGSLGGTKIYRQYLEFIDEPNNLNEDDIKNEIIKSLIFLKEYLKENNVRFDGYLNIQNDLIPVSIKHIYAGTISKYFYACFPWNKLVKYFFSYNNDVFYEFFNISKNEFIELLEQKRKNILKFKTIRELIKKIEEKF